MKILSNYDAVKFICKTLGKLHVNQSQLFDYSNTCMCCGAWWAGGSVVGSNPQL